MQVLFQDPYLIAVNKPGGMAVQADKTGDPHLLEHVAELFPADRHLGLPHRLDRPVSGAIIITRTAEALAAMGDLFSARGVEKTYWAIVHGAPPSAGVWEHRLSHDTRLHKARVLNDIEGASSRVSFKRLAAGDRYSVIALIPDGGRFHQLRAQCAAAGFPIKGDVKYGARRGEKDRTIALHARSLAFVHPVTGAAMRIEADPPGALWTMLLKGEGPLT